MLRGGGRVWVAARGGEEAEVGWGGGRCIGFWCFRRRVLLCGEDTVHLLYSYKRTHTDALFFSQMRAMLDLVERDVLLARFPGVAYLRMDGATPVHKRFGMQLEFNSGASLVLLM
jgi:SNF2 family DNA or RNA helicase